MYDYNFTKNVKEYCKSNPYLAIDMLEKYIVEYPDDYYNISLYINTLIRVGLFEEAYILCEKTLEKMENEKVIKNHKDLSKLDGIYISIITYKLKYYMYKKQYKRAFDFIIKYKQDLKRDNYFSLCSLRLFCMKKLGIKIQVQKYFDYTLKQIIDYSDDEFIEHIKKHLMDCEEDNSDENTNKFSIDFPFEQVYKELKRILPTEKKIYNGFFDNIYYFKYDNCGRRNGCLTDYFAVCTFDDSNELITMYPVKDTEIITCIELNYLRKDDNKKIKKKISQIEKFNRRYNK